VLALPFVPQQLIDAVTPFLPRAVARSKRERRNRDKVEPVMKVRSLMERLRKVIRDVPTREAEVQDAIENLLIGADILYDTGHIRDVDRFAGSFEADENVSVRVIKH